MSDRCLLYLRLCSLIPGLSVKLSVIVRRPTVLSAVGTCPLNGANAPRRPNTGAPSLQPMPHAGGPPHPRGGGGQQQKNKDKDKDKDH
jgi:hypothetical protein